MKTYYRDNIATKKAYSKAYHEANKDNPEYKLKARNRSSVWKTNNKERSKTNNRIYSKNRRANDVNFLLSHNLRVRLTSAIKINQKSGSAVRDLGCSIPEFKLYIENQFDPGMTWDNHGNKKGCWELDHVMPLSSFDLTDRMEFLEACNWLNIRPMWVPDNRAKGAKIGY